MNQAPCPNCGEMLTCRDKDAGQQIRCPKCKVLLQLDSEPSARLSMRTLLAVLRRRKSKIVPVGA